MKLTFTSDSGGDVYVLEVGGDLTVSDLKALLEMESSIPPSEQQLVHDLKVLEQDQSTLANCSIKDGDMIIVRKRQREDSAGPNAPNPSHPRIDWSQVLPPTSVASSSQSTQPFSSSQSTQPSSSSQSTQPSSSSTQPRSSADIDWSAVSVPTANDSSSRPDDPQSDVDRLWAELVSNPGSTSVLLARNPPLGEAVMRRDKESFRRICREQNDRRREEDMNRIRLLNADPFDMDSQRRIAASIQLENVEQNRLHAMEHTPESFGQVTMLYVDCKANKTPLKAFVDSGAQSTLMSIACVERCDLMHLVDRRWQGTAVGVGTQRIVGRVHLCDIQIGSDYLPCSFSILEHQPMDLLLGLDMLKRHQCCIDLFTNVLRIGTTGSEVPFLPEGELPSHARLARLASSDSLAEGEDQQLAQAIAQSEEETKKPSV